MLPFRYTTEQIEEINELAGDYVRSCVALRSHGEQMFPRAIWRSRLFTVGGMPITPCYQLGNSVDIILSANPDTSTYKSAADIFRQNLANVQTGAAGIGQAVGFEFKSR